MSLLSALYTGVSGLQSFGDSLQVIGDNIANVNTVGFKASRAEFSDLLSQSLYGASGRGQLGRGVALERITTNFSQGSFSNTDRLTDLAINGNGFFIVNGANGEQYYTRNGQFTLNQNGELVNSNGYQMMGYQYDFAGQVKSTTVTPLKINTTTTQPNPTGDGSEGSPGIYISANLNSTVSNNAAWDPTNASATSNFSTSIQVYDSQGDSHVMEVYFRKEADNQWSWHGLVDSGDIFIDDPANPGNLIKGTEGVPFEGGSGTLTFTEGGALQTVSGTSATFNFQGTDQEIALNFGDSIDDGATGLEGTTQFANPSVINTQTQDGFAAGSLASLRVDQDGSIFGVYTNGRTIPMAQIALANFTNVQGLFKSGSSMYSETTDSGIPLVGEPGVGTSGSISSYTLEQSNSDLATEFVNLISTQRAYQANTRIISTGDSLLNEVVNIIR